jgi:hypothetical protein
MELIAEKELIETPAAHIESSPIQPHGGSTESSQCSLCCNHLEAVPAVARFDRRERRYILFVVGVMST